MKNHDQLIAPLLRGNRRLEKKIEACLDLLDAAGLAAVSQGEEDELLVNATARADLRNNDLSPSEAVTILQQEDIVPIVADPGLLVWEHRPEKTSVNPLDSLSRRERQVAKWLRNGKSANETGLILGISPRTVEKHIERIYAKCGVRSHVEFVRLSFDEGS